MRRGVSMVSSHTIGHVSTHPDRDESTPRVPVVISAGFGHVGLGQISPFDDFVRQSIEGYSLCAVQLDGAFFKQTNRCASQTQALILGSDIERR